jgi:hypothetical protein
VIATLGRAVATSLLAGFGGVAAVAAVSAVRPDIVIDMSRDLLPPATGFYRSEFDGTVTFAWTGASASLELPGLDRRTPWTFRARLKGGRPETIPLPSVTIAVDGVNVVTERVGNVFTDLTVSIPAFPARRGAIVTLGVSNTFEPGPQDRRQLGVVVDEIVVAPSEGIALPPRDALLGAGTAGALMGAGFGVMGFTPGGAIGAALALTLLQSLPFAEGLAPYSALPHRAPRLALWVALGMASIAAGLERFRGQRLRQTARFVIAFAGGVSYLRMLVMLHPEMLTGDAVFHAHRFNDVLQGRLFFTSIAPGSYRFPYPIALYVAAAPFTWLISSVNQVVLLRVVTAVADAVAGSLIYLVIVRAWGDRLAGAIAAAVYFLIPLAFYVQITANLTNVFGQAWFVISLASITSPHTVLARPWSIALCALAIAIAFLSHTSTFAILSLVVLSIVVLYRTGGGAALQPAASAVSVAGGVAFLVAVGLYYAHFGEVYRDQYLRIAGEMAQPAAVSDPAGRSVLDRAASVPMYVVRYFGWPVLILAGAGVAWLCRRGWRDRLGLALAGWAFAAFFFLILGILTPVDMRHYLAVFPAVAIAAGLGASWGWRHDTLVRVLVSMLLVWTLVTAGAEWISALN